ncbi:MAG TPA: PKD domain-containing protein [Gemmatimonadaceae bacterium]|nr:PKD domain-containing protein [Gemmatimonadaceae bacterium]
MRGIERGVVAMLLVVAACTDGGSPSSPTKTPTLKHRLTSNVVGIGQAGTNFYQVFVVNAPIAGIGQYTVMTGPNHPVTISQGAMKNVLFGDGSPFTSYHSIHSYTTNTTYVTAPDIVPGGGVVALDPNTPGISASVVAIGTTGFRTTWTLAGPPQTPDKMTIVEVVDTHGATFETSTVEVTTSITNNGAAPIALGVRYLWDTQIGADDGPTFQQFSPDAAAIVLEKSFPNPSFQFYRIQDNDGNDPTPLFSVFGTVSGPSSVTPAPTPPDLIENANWILSSVSPFAYTTDATSDVSTINGTNDNAVLYYWGSTQSTAVNIAANATSSFSQSLVSAQANAPPPFNQSPVASITGPANNSSFAQGASVDFAGTGSDPEDGALTGASLVWTSSRDGQIGTGTSFSTTTLSVGTHVITLTVTDSQGAHGTATITVVITGAVQNQPPTAHITLPTDGASFVQGASVSFSGSGSDPEDGPVTGSALRWSSDRDGSLTTGATFSRTNLSVGTHVITLLAVDSKGLTGTATVTIHITAPAENQPPTAHITAPTAGAIFTPGASISFTGTGSDPEDGALSGASLVWTDNVAGQIGTGTTFSITTLAAGLHTVTLTATDSKGAKGSATVSFIVGFSQVIGSAGGSLCVEACHLSLFIPEGALSSSVTFVEYPLGNPPGAPAGIVGSAHVISPSVTFAANGALGIGYDPLTLPSGIAEGSLRIYQLVGGSWQVISNSNVNTTSHIVYAQVGGTGTFAIVGTP